MKAALIFEELEGRTVDGMFALLERLGGSADCGVFLTVRRGTQKAVIKLIRAEGADADSRLAQWEEAKTLSHPHLMEVFETGRFSIDGNDLVYVVFEHADEVLSDVVQHRPLDLDESKVILISILSALSYLHARGFIHGHVKPSNIFRIGDSVKLSTDDFLVTPEVQRKVGPSGSYDAPEIESGEIAPMADSWSVGMTLAEIMTQHLPVWNESASDAPVVPKSLPRLYSDIVRDCLRVDPRQRSSVREIKTYLASDRPLAGTPAPPAVPVERIAREQKPVEPERAPESAPVAAPIAPAAPQPTRFQQKPMGRWEEIEAGPPQEEETEPAAPLPELFTQYEEAEPRRFRVMPFLLGALVLLAIAAFLLVRSGKLNLPWLHQMQTAIGIRPSTPQSQSGTTPQDQIQTQSPSEATASPQAGGQATTTPAPAPPEESATPSATSPAANPASPGEHAKEAQAPATQPAQPPSEESHTAIPKHEPPEPGKEPGKAKQGPREEAPEPVNSEGAVAKQVMPYVSGAAIQSMHGPVRVTVRVSVDRNGKVSDASYVSPGEGNYFARISRRAAESWKFDPPRQNGRPQPSAWTLRFYFTHAKPEVSATQDE